MRTDRPARAYRGLEEILARAARIPGDGSGPVPADADRVTEL
jgi:hypothetical protein